MTTLQRGPNDIHRHPVITRHVNTPQDKVKVSGGGWGRGRLYFTMVCVGVCVGGVGVCVCVSGTDVCRTAAICLEVGGGRMALSAESGRAGAKSDSAISCPVTHTQAGGGKVGWGAGIVGRPALFMHCV